VAKKTNYVRTIHQTMGEDRLIPINMVATVIKNIKAETDECIVVQFQGRVPEDFHPYHLEYITKKEYFVSSLLGPGEIE